MCAIRSQVLRAYGEVYAKAWRAGDDGKGDGKGEGSKGEAKGASPLYRARLEGCLQDLMTCAVHCREGRTSGACLAALAPLHEAKGQRGVDALLTRLWSPILWRALKCANPLVRRQATLALAQAFPLGDSAGAGEDQAGDDDELLQRQFDAMVNQEEWGGFGMS